MQPLTERLKKEIVAYVENNQPEIDWEPRDINEYFVKMLLKENPECIRETLWDMCIDDIDNAISSTMFNACSKFNPDSIYNDDDIELIVDQVVQIDFNIDQLFRVNPYNILTVLYVCSNYDCCNSFDEFEPETYLGDVYRRVKAGVRKEDYMYEFHNGAYGGSLFCFVFNTNLANAVSYKEQFKEAGYITIPKDTQFGFFSSFNGCGSVFEKRTWRDLILPITEPDHERHGGYDYIGMKFDLLQKYSFHEVYGETNERIFNKGFIQFSRKELKEEQ